jgi:hypothetical protein
VDAVEVFVERRRHREGGGVDQGRLVLARAGEVEGFYRVLVVDDVVADVEEAGEGLGHLGAVVGVGDEGEPLPADALEAVQRLGGQPRQDLQDEVFGEAGRGVGVVHLD